MAKKIKDDSVPVLSVKHIGVLSFNLRQFNFSKENPNVTFSVSSNLRFAVDINIINLTLFVSYQQVGVSDPFLTMEIENIFELTELNRFVNTSEDITPDQMNIPENILIAIASTSFSHARAIVSQHIGGTFAQGIYLSIIDGRDFARSIFGNDKVK